MANYLKRLLLFSFLLGTLPVLVTGWLSYSAASRDMEEKVKEEGGHVLLQTQMRVEQVLKTLELSAIQFVNSPEFVATANRKLSEENYEEIRTLSKGLYQLQTLTGINDAYLINFRNDWLVNYRLFRTLTSEPQRERFLAYAGHPDSLFWVTPGQTDARSEEEREAADGEPMIRMVLKIPTVPAVRPEQMLVIELPEGDIETLLGAGEGFGTHYVLDPGRAEVVVGQVPEGAAGRNSLIVQKVLAGGAEQGFFRMEDGNGAELGVSYRKSAYNNWIYTSVVSMKEMGAASRKIAVITGLVCLAVAAVVAVLAFYGSRRMYTPIRRLFDATRAMGGEGEAAAALDEFSYIESRLRDLSLTGRELRDQLSKHAGQLKELYMLKLFTGQTGEKDYHYQAEKYGFPSGWHRLTVLTLQIDSLRETRYREEDQDLLLFAIGNMVGELLPEPQCFRPVVLDSSQVTLLASALEDPQELKNQVHGMAEDIRSKVGEYLGLKVSIGISRPFERIGETVEAYSESLYALRSRLSLGSDIVVHYGDIGTGGGLSAAGSHHLRLLEDQIVHALKMNPERVPDLFEEYMCSVADKGMGFGEHAAVMIQLVAKVYGLVQEQGNTVEHVCGPRASMEVFLKLHTLEQLKSWFTDDLLGPAASHLNTQADSQHTDIAGRMLRMIQEQYDEDLSLDSCASALNFHPVYLSRVFKKETGVNFSEYLMEYRMKVARQMLEESNIRISDIADKLRYTNTSAFIRVFRKVVGMTPGKYREQCGGR
ncbi:MULTISPECIES: AraC family transcriptional regulator [Paenibacillus]|uniref:AraC family transcriptional regulator n=1 Tax=Paenibacillus TaxID=44249 RepID=UPI0022B8AF0B|nr:helix-turn-helix domain-containing protein [Paenibacillus caseinilyticus]MCZ8522544.1 helix-turn-helix domain-containing protein [Paenibacillus caseinilyticus]